MHPADFSRALENSNWYCRMKDTQATKEQAMTTQQSVEQQVSALRELLDTGDVSDWHRMEDALLAAIAALSQSQSAQAGGGDVVAWHCSHPDVNSGRWSAHDTKPSDGAIAVGWKARPLIYGDAPPASPAAAAVPEGFVLVPVKPTEAMKLAAWKLWDAKGDAQHQVWEAMLAAAQKDGA